MEAGIGCGRAEGVRFLVTLVLVAVMWGLIRCWEMLGTVAPRVISVSVTLEGTLK